MLYGHEHCLTMPIVSSHEGIHSFTTVHVCYANNTISSCMLYGHEHCLTMPIVSSHEGIHSFTILYMYVNNRTVGPKPTM